MADNDLNSLAQRVRDDEVAEFAQMLVGTADPNAVVSAGETTLYWDRVNDVFYINDDGATGWTQWPGGGGVPVPHQLLNNPWHTDTVTSTPPAAGSVIVSTAGFAWAETVHPGAATQFLRANAAIPGWAAIAGADLPWTGAANEMAYWSGVNTLTGDAGLTYNGNDLIVLNEDQNADTTIRVSNANAGAAAYSQVLIKNAAGVGDADALMLACFGTGFTTAALSIQDSALIAAGTSLSGGLVIRTDTTTDIIFGTNNVEVVRFASGGAVTIAGLGAGFVQSNVAGVLSSAAIIVGDLPAHTHSGAGQGGSLVVGTTDTDATAGSVFFAGVAGVIQEDNASLFFDDTNNALGIRSNAPHGSADALYVPWVTGDTQTTAVFGSANASNDQIAIEAYSYTNHGIYGQSNALCGVRGVSTSNNGVYGSSTSGVGVTGTSTSSYGVNGISASSRGVAGQSTSGTGVEATSNIGDALIANLTAAGTAIADFQDNGATVWSILDGGNMLCGATGTLDLNGVADALILDADADTTISAPTDDQIDFEAGGADVMALNAVGLGIGIVTTDSHLNVYDATLNSASTFYGLRSYHIKTAGAGGAGDDYFGIDSHMELDQATTIDNLVSFATRGLLTAGTADTVKGAALVSQVTGGTVDERASGLESTANIDGGTVNDVFGVRAFVDIEAAATIGGDVFGAWIQIDDDAGAAGTVYGMYIEQLTGVDYGIYVNGSADNYFGGNVGVGITAPGNAHVNIRDMTLTSTATFYGIQSEHIKTAGAGAAGDDYFGILSTIEINQATAVDNVQGAVIQGILTLGTADIIRGVSGIASVAGGTVNVRATATNALVDIDGGTVDDVYGGRYNVDIEGAATIGGDVYGLWVRVDDDAGATGDVSMLYLDELSGVDYGVYQNGAADNRFGGVVLRPGWFCGYAAEQTAFDGTLTDIDIDTEIREDATYYTHAAGSDNITITEAGWYRFSYCVNVRDEDTDRACVRVWVYDDGAAITHSLGQTYIRLNTYGRYSSIANSFIAEVGAGSVIDLRTDAQAGAGAFGAGANDYDVLEGSQITIERVDE